MTTRTTLALFAMVGMTTLGCERADKGGSTAAVSAVAVNPTATAVVVSTRTPAAWSAAAIKTAEELLSKVKAAGIACDDVTPPELTEFGADANHKLPVAGVAASCTSENDEDLTFEVFEGPSQAELFITSKLQLLCYQAIKAQLPDFPGFVYVASGNWILEPDEKETADKLAPILGGESKMASCPQAPTPATP